MRVFTEAKRRVSAVLSLCATLAITGCHSAFIQAKVINHTGGTVTLFEVDYPNAGFGSGQLPDGAEFPYRFKVLGNGPMKVTWTDAAQKDHIQVGPSLREGDEGTLQVTLEPGGARWTSSLHNSSTAR